MESSAEERCEGQEKKNFVVLSSWYETSTQTEISRTTHIGFTFRQQAPKSSKTYLKKEINKRK